MCHPCKPHIWQAVASSASSLNCSHACLHSESSGGGNTVSCSRPPLQHTLLLSWALTYVLVQSTPGCDPAGTPRRCSWAYGQSSYPLGHDPFRLHRSITTDCRVRATIKGNSDTPTPIIRVQSPLLAITKRQMQPECP